MHLIMEHLPVTAVWRVFSWGGIWMYDVVVIELLYLLLIFCMCLRICLGIYHYTEQALLVTINYPCVAKVTTSEDSLAFALRLPYDSRRKSQIMSYIHRPNLATRYMYLSGLV